MKELPGLWALALWVVANGPAQAATGSRDCFKNPRTGERYCKVGVASASEPATRNRPAGLIRAYRNCTAARAAGAAPIMRGEPGYGPHLDRDNDGIACEPPRR